MSKHFIPSISLLVLALFFSCTSENSGKETGTPVIIDPPIKPTKPEAAYSPIPKVNVFLEISGGMVGFMPRGGATGQATEFQTKVSGLISEIQNSQAIQSKDYYFIREKDGNALLVKESYDPVQKTVRSGTAHPALGTELPEMLQQILKESEKSNAVSVVISDFIYGPADKDKLRVVSQLIRDALGKAQDNDFVVSIFGGQSAFNGIYYPAIKKPKQEVVLAGTKMPYYIWVIGRQNDVQLFNSKVFKKPPAEQAHYGFKYPTPNFEAVPKYNSKGNIYCNTKENCKSVTLGVEEGEPVEFEIGVNLHGIPESLQSTNYLKNNLKLNGQGIAAIIIKVKKADNKVKSDPYLDKYTHFIRVKVTDVSSDKGKLTITLPESEPDWISKWSTLNDNNPVSSPGKTFKLNEIMKGAENLYSNQSNIVFKLSININKYKD